MEDKRFLNVNDVAVYMDVSVPKAYKIIRTLNAELNEKGYITVAGKVNRLFFEEKTYCGTSS